MIYIFRIGDHTNDIGNFLPMVRIWYNVDKSHTGYTSLKHGYNISISR